METITLKKGDFIRYIYNGQYEYCVWHGNNSRTIIAGQSHVDAWRAGSRIEPLIGCDSAAYQANARLEKEALRDQSRRIIQGVWKQNQFIPRIPRKIIAPKTFPK